MNNNTAEGETGGQDLTTQLPSASFTAPGGVPCAVEPTLLVSLSILCKCIPSWMPWEGFMLSYHGETCRRGNISDSLKSPNLLCFQESLFLLKWFFLAVTHARTLPKEGCRCWCGRRMQGPKCFCFYLIGTYWNQLKGIANCPWLSRAQIAFISGQRAAQTRVFVNLSIFFFLNRKQSSVNKDKWLCSLSADPGAKLNRPLMVWPCFIDCSDSPVMRQMYPDVPSSLLSVTLCSFCLRCH